jgi:hypothetical protein
MTLLKNRHHCLVLLALVLVVVPGFGGASAIATQTEGARDEWVYLGPSAYPIRAEAVAVAANWPADRFILATNRKGAIRSNDGGESWEPLQIDRDVTHLTVGDGSGGRRVIFGGSGGRLSRSLDDGTTWTLVLEQPGQGVGFNVRMSPSFARDGLAFAVRAGELFRSNDEGATWQRLDPTGQQVQQLEFSPDVERDGMIFASMVSGDLTVPMTEPDPGRVEGNVRSVGMMISTDRGDSWSTMSSGLEIEGAPYRLVVRFAVSPAFAQDGTIVALAWGPVWGVVPSGHVTFAAAHGLFRSSDRGATWAPVWRGSFNAVDSSAQHVTGPFRRADIVLSPNFGSDGTGLLLATTGLGVGPSSGCEIYRTDDHGATWALIPFGGSAYPSLQSDSSCGRVWLTGATVGTNAIGWRRLSARSSTTNWFSSRDASLTWFLEPSSGPFVASPGAVGQAVDGTIFVGGQVGIWTLGPSAQPDPPD